MCSGTMLVNVDLQKPSDNVISRTSSSPFFLLSRVQHNASDHLCPIFLMVARINEVVQLLQLVQSAQLTTKCQHVCLFQKTPNHMLPK